MTTGTRVSAGDRAPAEPPAPTAVPVRPARIARLDVLRAIAVLLVMLRHVAPVGADHPRLAGAVEFARLPAWLGVDLFFVLSGFLVSGLLFREAQRHGEVDAWRFLVRRGFKIYPTYYLFVLGTWAWLPFPKPPGGLQLAQYLAFVQNYATWQPSPWVHLWSVAVEEHFYLLLAAAFAWRFRPGRARPTLREAGWTWAALAALTLVLRLMAAEPLVRASGALAVARPAQFSQTHFRLEVATLGPHGASTGARAWERPLAAIGAQSYSIYVWHLVARSGADALAPGAPGGAAGWLVEALLYMVLSIGLGVAMARLVELPALALRDRWFPSRSGG
ncbi:MAG: acyltransferase [Gemmatimonadetes bacterium]|nr:acyltransferase [Gemmatimonadota bacterium]